MAHEPRPPRHPLEGPHPDEKAKAAKATTAQKRRVGFTLAARRPYLTYGLIVINVLIYGLSQFVPQTFEVGALFPVAVLGNFELPRLLTSMFLHANLPHLMLNMVSLYVLGREMEMLYGRERFVAIYFLGGLMGSILSVSIGDYAIPAVGASGAIIAVWGAQMVFLYLNRLLFGEERIRQVLVQNGVFLLMFFLIGFVPGAIVDNWGHIGGFVGGAIVASLVPIRLVVKQVTMPDRAVEAMVVDANPWSAAMLSPLSAYGIGLLLLLMLGIGGYRLALFPTTLFQLVP